MCSRNRHLWSRKLVSVALALAPVWASAQNPTNELTDVELIQARNLITVGNLGEADKIIRQFLASHADSPDARELLGYVLFKENDPKASLAEYLAVGQHRSLGAPEYEVMGCDYFLLEDYASADKWLTRAVDSGNRNALSLYLLGRTKYNERQFEKAASVLEQSLALDANSVRAQTYLGRAYEQLGRREDALATYRKATALDDVSSAPEAEPYAALGALLIENNQASSALQYLRKAGQLAPADAAVHRELGKTYLSLNQAAQARTELEKAIALDPQNAPAHFLLAQAYQKLRMLDKARAEQSRYAQLSSSHSAPDDTLSGARGLIESGQIAAAEQVMRQYVELHRNSADAHYLLGYILFKKQDARGSLAEYTEAAKYRTPTAHDFEVVGADYVLLRDYSDADKWLTKSVAWDSRNWQALYYLARTKYNENRFEEAVKIFTQCLQLQPKSVKAEDNLGLSLEGLGRIDEAMTAYRNAISWQNGVTRQDAGPYYDLGALLVANDRAPEGLPYLRQALGISPQDVRVHRELGKAYLHLNQLDQAEAELEKSIQLAPDNAPTHFILAQVYRKRGLEEKARLEIERYTSLAAAHSTDSSQ